MTTNLRIQLLGDFTFADDGTPLTGANTPRLQSLLAYLLLHRDAPQSRTHLAFQFWPDSTEAQARSNLRTLIHRLRGALPDANLFLHVDAQAVQWRPGAPFTLDVAEFEAALAQAKGAQQSGDEGREQHDLEGAVALYGGDLLPSCYDDWILPERERLNQAYLDALEQLVGLLEDQRAYEQAIAYARRLLRHDPLHEAGYRRLMHLRALDGDRAGALRVYHTCATALQRELGVEPSPLTQRAYEDLLQAEDRPTLAARTALGLTPLVGREEEWSQLQTAWRRSRRGPRLVLLQGEAGIGKTRLVEELLDWAARQGIAHSYARCYAAEGELAYAPVTALLRARPLPPLDDLWLSEVSRLLPEVLAERPDLPPPRPMTEAWQRQRLFEALARAALGDSSSASRLLLVVDDLQWCDRETLDWLHFLLRFDPEARLLLVGTCRPEELDEDCPLTATLPVLHRDVRLREVELGPLDEAQTVDLASHVAGRQVDEAAGRRLHRETEGNPLFVVETLRAGQPLAEEELDATGAPLPPRVQAVLETRLAQLSPPARELAGLAATVGRSFAVPVLEQAGDGDEDALVQGLDELWQRRIVRERGADAYDFGHDKLREAAYNMLSPARRRLLHRRVAQALEAVYARQPDAVAAQIAAHLDRAGQAEQAIQYYLQAGEAANRIYAREETITSFQQGLALLKQGAWKEDRQDWYREMEAGLYERLGDVFRRVARYPEAIDAYEGARAAVPDVDHLRHAMLLSKIGETWWPQGDYERAMRAANEAKSILGPEPAEPDPAWWEVWTSVQFYKAMILYYSNQTEELAKTVEEMEKGLKHCSTPQQWWRARAAHWQVTLRRDRYVVTDEYVIESMSRKNAFDQLEDLDLKAWGYYGFGWMLLLHGDLDAAQDYLEQGLAMAERTGHMVYLTWLLTWLSVLHRQRHEPEPCLRYALRGLKVAPVAGLAENAALARGNLAWLAWCDGDYEEVENQGRAALELWQKSPFVYAFHWAARLPLMAVDVEKGQLPEAVEHAGAMLDHQQHKLPDPLEAALESAVQAAEHDHPVEARQHLERAVTVAQETGFL